MSFERHTYQPPSAEEWCGHETAICQCEHSGHAHRSGRCENCSCERFQGKPCRAVKGRCGHANGSRRRKEEPFELEVQATTEFIKRLDDNEERKRITDPSKCGVYFIRCEGFIKIGKTQRIDRRLWELQLASPFQLVLVAFIQGRSTKIEQIETQFHRRFKKLHHRGEWFRLAFPLTRFIESLKKAGDGQAA